jgi:hypothetical protein
MDLYKPIINKHQPEGPHPASPCGLKNGERPREIAELMACGALVNRLWDVTCGAELLAMAKAMARPC